MLIRSNGYDRLSIEYHELRLIINTVYADLVAVSGTSDRRALPDSQWRSRMTPGAVRWRWRRFVHREFRRCATDTARPLWRWTTHRETSAPRPGLASRTHQTSPAKSFRTLSTSALRLRNECITAETVLTAENLLSRIRIPMPLM